MSDSTQRKNLLPAADSRFSSLGITGGANWAEGPNAFLSSLTLVVQELTGAQSVVLFQVSDEKTSQDFRMAAVSPPGFQPTNPEVLRQLASFGGQVDNPVIWGTGTGPAQAEVLLSRHDLWPMILVPIVIEKKKLGQLMLLKLPKDQRTDLTLSLLLQQSDLVALIFHQALSTQKAKNGSLVFVETTARQIDYNQQTAILSISRDVTQRKEQEKKLRLAAAVFENTTEGVMVTDAHRKIIMVNRAFSNITGYEAVEALGRTPGFLRSRRHSRDFYKQMWLEIEEAGSWRGEIWNRHKKGGLFPQWLNISTVRNEAGQIVNYVAVFMDISAAKKAEAELQHLAHHDFLTGLPNRLLFKDRLEHAVAVEQRNKGRFAVLFIDLDRFKQVNDTFGHPTGDELLKLAARRLLTCVRQQDTVARLGGDEFAMLLEGLSHSKDSGQVAQNVIQSLTAPFHLHGHDIHISASIGISIYPDDGSDSIALLKNADSAMFRAKNRGRNTYRFYTPSLNAAAKNRYALETSLRQALHRNEFFLHYQPQFDLTHSKIVAVEALLRWRHSQKGLIAPDQFIPIAEETGMIVAIGRWVLSHACRQAMAWRRQGRDPLTIAVNISATQFHHYDFLPSLDRILGETGLPAQFLELEITESMIMSDIHAATAIMQRLRTRGVQLAIDDFGTGYSSLAYLKRFPIQKLKIDQSFVRGILSDPADTAIVNTIINLGRNLNLVTVAEGVETKDQLEFLTENQCDLGQGYLLGRPAAELP